MFENLSEKSAFLVTKKIEIYTPVLEVGDTIQLKNGYTATCQKITDDGALMLLDQYVMHEEIDLRSSSPSNNWKNCILRKILADNFVLQDFIPDNIFCHLGYFENGDRVRIPMIKELIEKCKNTEYQDAEQWALMKDPKNRLAFHPNGKSDGCWCMDKCINKHSTNLTSNFFWVVDHTGQCYEQYVGIASGVRPVFLIV